MIGLDSCAVIDLFRGDESLKEVIEKTEEDIVLNNICYLELMFGLDLNNSGAKKEEQFYDELFDSLENFILDRKSSKKASQVLNELKRKGEMIEPMDCVIGAIYLTNGVNSIITRNVKHFSKIKDLKVISY